MTTYKDLITSAMTMIGHCPKTFAVGYNITRVGGFGGGTFAGFPEERMVEMPLAECCMTGLAIGMSLYGWIPILFFERADFVFLALDQIVNTLDKLVLLSNGQHRPAVIIRVAVGNSQMPLYTGPTHTQDPSVAIAQLVTFKVVRLQWPSSIVGVYAKAMADAQEGKSTMLFEYRDQFNET